MPKKKGAIVGLGAFLGLEIGKSGVLTHQRAINVVSHNITNAETAGYSRVLLVSLVLV